MESLRSSLPARVLVLGAGWLGAPLAESFAANGCSVTTVRRSPHTPPAGGRAVPYDLRLLAHPDAPPLPEPFRDHELVLAMVAPDRARGDDHEHTYPAVAEAAARIASESGARALCWISSTGVYGYADGREVTERSSRAADSPAQRALCRAEDTILAAASDRVRVGVLRASGLYGPGRDPAPRYRAPAALAPRAAQWVNLAWRDDVIAAVHCWSSHALADTAAPPSVLNVSDSTPLTVAECARLVARADGRAFVMPEPTPTAGASTPPPVAPMRSNQRIRVDALRSLGWTPQVPNLRAGLLQLGYSRLAHEQQPYGPQTAQIRAFLRALAALDVAQHDDAVARWTVHLGTAAFTRADRQLGEVLIRAGREAERDAAAGPLLQMLRSTNADEAGDALDPIAEPALAALMALLVRDVLPADTFNTLTAPLYDLVQTLDGAA